MHVTFDPGRKSSYLTVSKFLYHIPQYSWLFPNKLPFPCWDWFTGFCVECMPAPSIGIPIMVYQGIVTYMSPVEAFATGIKNLDLRKSSLIA